MEGTVKIANSRGFGFIATSKGIDYYFHYTAFKGEWKHLLVKIAREESVTVDFENDPTATDGPRAVNVIPR